MDFLSEKKILVTGATGLIGSSLVNELVKAGALVIAGSREKEKLIDIFKSNRSKNLTLRAFDVVEKVPEDKLSFVIQIMQGVNGLIGVNDTKGKEVIDLNQFVMASTERGQNADNYVRELRDNDRF